MPGDCDAPNSGDPPLVPDLSRRRRNGKGDLDNVSVTINLNAGDDDGRNRGFTNYTNIIVQLVLVAIIMI